jgi:hydrogenase nickel incorporation protein HypA/HybF
MHEVGIAQSLMDVVFDTAKNNGAKIVNKIFVKIGRLQAVESSSLMFAFDALKDGTIAEEGELIIENVPLTGKCMDCAHENIFEQIFMQCPKCGSSAVQILTGEELQITEIEVD